MMADYAFANPPYGLETDSPAVIARGGVATIGRAITTAIAITA